MIWNEWLLLVLHWERDINICKKTWNMFRFSKLNKASIINYSNTLNIKKIITYIIVIMELNKSVHVTFNSKCISQCNKFAHLAMCWTLFWTILSIWILLWFHELFVLFHLWTIQYQLSLLFSLHFFIEPEFTVNINHSFQANFRSKFELRNWNILKTDNYQHDQSWD